MASLKDFVIRKGPMPEAICSKCCQIVRPSPEVTLEEAQAQHQCG